MIRRLEREPIGQIEAIWLPIDLHSFEPRPAFLADVFAHELPLEAAWYTRRGARHPAFASTAAKLRARSFDGEAVVCGPDGVAILDALHRHGTVSEAMLYAFDLLELDDENLRALQLGDRKKRLAKLVGKRRIGIVAGRGDGDVYDHGGLRDKPFCSMLRCTARWKGRHNVRGHNGINACVSASGNLFRANGLEGRHRRNAAEDRCAAATANDVATSAGFQQSIVPRRSSAPSCHDAHY
jgi:hypothetical protein